MSGGDDDSTRITSAEEITPTPSTYCDDGEEGEEGNDERKATASRKAMGVEAKMGIRDGNGYPLPDTRWVFILLGVGFGLYFLSMGLLIGFLFPNG